jgi:hypothetical protein
MEQSHSEMKVQNNAWDEGKKKRIKEGMKKEYLL